MDIAIRQEACPRRAVANATQLNEVTGNRRRETWGFLDWSHALSKGISRVAALGLGVSLTSAFSTAVRAADLPGQLPLRAPTSVAAPVDRTADMPPRLPVKAPVPYVSTAYDWNGWYVGAHFGVIRGSSNWSATQPGSSAPGFNGSFNLP